MGEHHLLALSDERRALTAALESDACSNRFGQLGNGVFSGPPGEVAPRVPPYMRNRPGFLPLDWDKVHKAERDLFSLEPTVTPHEPLAADAVTFNEIVVANAEARDSVARDVVDISAGANHNLLLCADGSVLAFGANTRGQCGIGATEPATDAWPAVLPKAQQVKLPMPATAIAAGREHSLVLCSDKSQSQVVAFGCGLDGELGNGQASDAIIAMPISFLRTRM